MALPAIMRRLFAGDGYGPLLKDDIVSKHISIQDWSSGFDYQPATVVRGADGLLYWSVAQSGPNVGGAQDPTADDGTYWSAPKLPTMPPADKSKAGATTEWVKNFASTFIYVDPAGSDSNDGYSSATAVKTITKALDLAKDKIATNNIGVVIYIAAGTYAEDINVQAGSCVFLLDGNVTVNGDLRVNNRNLLTIYISNSTDTLYVNGSITVQNSSTIRNTANIVVTPQGENNAVDLLQTSTFLCWGNFTARGSCTGACFRVRESSTAILEKNFSLSSSLSGGNAILLTAGGSLLASGAVSIDCSGSGICISVSLNSFLHITSLGIIHRSAANVVQATNGSLINLGPTNITLSVAAARFFYASGHCCILLDNLNLSGTVSTCSIAAYYLSYVNIPSSATVTGSVTGKRYAVSSGSNIAVYGAGENRIPGNAAGSVTSASYGYYG